MPADESESATPRGGSDSRTQRLRDDLGVSTQHNWVKRKIAKGIACVVVTIVKSEIETASLFIQLHDAQSNHARFEGTWAPYEASMASIGHEIEKEQRRIFEHASAEGAYLPPNYTSRLQT